MTKYEEILRGILQIICDTASDKKYVTANEIMKYLRSQDVLSEVMK